MLKLFTTFLRVNLQIALAYRVDTLVNILLNVMWLGWELLSLSIIFSNTEALGGWGLWELIALLGVFRLVNTLMAAVIWPNTEKFNTERPGWLARLPPAPAGEQPVPGELLRAPWSGGSGIWRWASSCSWSASTGAAMSQG